MRCAAIPKLDGFISAMTEFLKIRDLHTSYGMSQVLFGVSLDVQQGELVSLLGRNGVGKSTTIRSIMGLTPPASGSIIWKGHEIAGHEPHQNVADGIGFVPEDRRIFSDLTVWENLDIARRSGSGGAVIWDEHRIFDLFPDLAQFRSRKGGVLSGGQQQMLTIARSLMGNPELLLMDEPSEGLAPLIVEAMSTMIKEIKGSGMSIILAEQNLEFVLALSDRIYVMEKGEVKYTGTAKDLRDSDEVLKKYLEI